MCRCRGVETDGAKRLATDAAKSSVLLGRYSMYRTTAFSFDRHDELQNRLRLFTQPTRQRKTLQQRHLSHIRSAIATFKIVTSLRPQAISPTAAAVSCQSPRYGCQNETGSGPKSLARSEPWSVRDSWPVCATVPSQCKIPGGGRPDLARRGRQTEPRPRNVDSADLCTLRQQWRTS